MERARYFSSKGYHGRDLKAIFAAQTADMSNLENVEKMRLLYPASTSPAERQPRNSLPSAPTLSTKSLKQKLKGMDETTTPGPDGLKVIHLKMAVRRMESEKPELSCEARLAARRCYSSEKIFEEGPNFPSFAELFASARMVGIFSNQLRRGRSQAFGRLRSA